AGGPRDPRDRAPRGGRRRHRRAALAPDRPRRGEGARVRGSDQGDRDPREPLGRRREVTVTTVAHVATIETARLRLEPWGEDRLDDFVRLAADPRVTGHFGQGSPWSRRRSEARFAEALGHWTRYGFGWRSAVDRSSGEWLGFVGLNFARPESIELAPRSVEIGWWLDPSAWGRGYATEGAIALRDEGFERVALDRLWARYQVANKAAARGAEKIGMSPDRVGVGRLRAAKRVQAESPEQGVGIGGCWAQSLKDEVFDRFPFVDVAFGPGQVPKLAEFLTSDSITAQGFFEFEGFTGRLPARREREFQAWVQISVGCNCRCAYCIVPSTRGREVSRPAMELVTEVARLAGA